MMRSRSHLRKDLMQLTLDEKDTRVLRDILKNYLPDLRRQAAATDLPSRELRHELADRERLCERLLRELEQNTAGPGTRSS